MLSLIGEKQEFYQTMSGLLFKYRSKRGTIPYILCSDNECYTGNWYE